MKIPDNHLPKRMEERVVKRHRKSIINWYKMSKPMIKNYRVKIFLPHALKITLKGN